MTLADVLQALERAAAELPADQLPALIGGCAATQAKALARMITPPTTTVQSADEWVTAAEVARRFNLSISTVNELARLGRLPHRMFGRFRRFHLTEVAAAGLDSKSDEHGTPTKGRKAA